MKIVLQKFIAESGLCSRRQAEELIRKGKVIVNGELAELGTKVDEKDEIKVKGRVLRKEEKEYIKLNKPKGYTCTARAFKDEKNVFDIVRTKERLFVVGRLDKDSRGLVLLTNDGDLAQKLTHPKFKHEKEYLITIENKLAPYSKSGQADLKILTDFKKGVDIGDGDGIVKAKDIKFLGDNKFKLVLTEGKKRQIRRMFQALGAEVKDLVRVRIGNLQLDELKEGEWKYLDKREIENLKSKI